MADNVGKHVMLSYQWDSQPIVERIKNELEKRGYDTWMDIDDMKGNIHECMAQGVEKAAVVISCVSNAYKHSHNCQKELTFADVSHKTIIPLKMEKDVAFDGWLGLIMAGKLWIDFKDEKMFDQRIDQLIAELTANDITCNVENRGATDSQNEEELLSLSVDGVCQWLKCLEIKDSDIGKFKRNCVNGDDLAVLSEEVLVGEQFKIEPFIASKIIRNRNKALEKDNSGGKDDDNPLTKKGSASPYKRTMEPVQARVTSETGKGNFKCTVKTVGQAGKDLANFNHPFGVAWTPNNLLLVADQFNHRVQMFNTDFQCVDVLTFEGQFSKPFKPYDIAVSIDNLYYITDYGNNQVIVTDENKKIVRVMCQNEGELYGITLMGEYVIVTDCAGNRLMKFTKLGDKVAEVKGDLKYPYSVAATSDQRIVVTDSRNNRIQVFTADLKLLFTYGSKGSGYGELLGPWGVSVDSKNNIYISDGNGRIVRLTDKREFEVLYSGIQYPCYIAVHEGPPFKIAVAQGTKNKIMILYL
ncbi:uncharacterized protein LOC144445678 [Glandiceps talaboti]